MIIYRVLLKNGALQQGFGGSVFLNIYCVLQYKMTPERSQNHVKKNEKIKKIKKTLIQISSLGVPPLEYHRAGWAGDAGWAVWSGSHGVLVPASPGSPASRAAVHSCWRVTVYTCSRGGVSCLGWVRAIKTRGLGIWTCVFLFLFFIFFNVLNGFGTSRVSFCIVKHS